MQMYLPAHDLSTITLPFTASRNILARISDFPSSAPHNLFPHWNFGFLLFRIVTICHGRFLIVFVQWYRHIKVYTGRLKTSASITISCNNWRYFLDALYVTLFFVIKFLVNNEKLTFYCANVLPSQWSHTPLHYHIELPETDSASSAAHNLFLNWNLKFFDYLEL